MFHCTPIPPLIRIQSNFNEYYFNNNIKTTPLLNFVHKCKKMLIEYNGLNEIFLAYY